MDLWLITKRFNGDSNVIEIVTPQHPGAIRFDLSPQMVSTLKKEPLFYMIEDGVIKFNPRYTKIYPYVDVQQKIDSVKAELTGSDYKIIKCYEASLMGSLMPYDYQKLIGEREMLRAQIRELEDLKWATNH